jgi:hypothetical protein
MGPVDVIASPCTPQEAIEKTDAKGKVLPEMVGATQSSCAQIDAHARRPAHCRH